MAKYNADQIAALGHHVGLRGDALAIATAVALAESGGQTDAVNDRGEMSIGLWQINTQAHPQYAVDELKNPVKNAMAMAAISGGGKNWQPWSAYKNGTYLAFLPVAKVAAARSTGLEVVSIGEGGDNTGTGLNVPDWIPGGGIVEDVVEGPGVSVTSGAVKVAGGAVDAVTDVASAAVTFVRVILDPKTWLTVLKVVGGGLLLLFALSRLFPGALPLPPGAASILRGGK